VSSGIVSLTAIAAQSSGTTNAGGIDLTYSINNTGTYVGTHRGIYYNPTLTSLTGTTHIAIETVTGNTILGSTSGNTLIGTTTDAGYKLDVNGTARVVGTLNVGTTGTFGNISLKRTSDGSDVGGIRADSSGTQIGGSGYLSNILLNNGTTGTNGIIFTTGGERMRLFGATGNLGIGIATDAGYKLDVNGTARVSGTLSVKTTSGQQRISFSNTDQIYIGLGANNNQIGANSSNRLYIGSEGDLPIYTLAGGTVIVADLANPASSASAKLRIDSTTQGFLPPRMTTTQKNAIATPATGLVVYDTTDNKHYGYNGTTWNAFY
jgi:hypothetical protein